MLSKQNQHGHQLRKHPLPTPREVARYVAYNPITGEFWTRGGPVTKPEGEEYLRVHIGKKPNRQRHYAHRVAFVLMNGNWPHLVNHIDGDKLNNRWDNLEETTNGANQRAARWQNEKFASRKPTKEGLFKVAWKNGNKTRNVLFRLWRDANRFQQYLTRGFRDHGETFEPVVPPRDVRCPKYVPLFKVKPDEN